MEYMIGEMINCNPSVKLKKGDSYPLIDMEKITVGNKYVTSEEFAEYSGQSSSKFSNGDTLLARITPCLENGKVAQCKIDGSGFGSTELFVFRGIPGKTDNDYVYYLMSSKYIRDMATNSMTGASGRQRADLGFIKRIKWDFPDMPTQKQIVRKLKNYDDLIELNNKRIKLLEQTAQEVYKEWFVRGRNPLNESTDKWRTVRLKEVMSFVRGVGYSSEDIACGENTLLSMNNIRPYGGFIADYTRLYSGNYKESQIVGENDLIMCITDMTQDRRIIGYVGLVGPDCGGFEKRIICTHLLKVISSDYDNLFLYYHFNYSGLSRNIAEFATGVNVLGLTADILEKVKYRMPSVELTEYFVNIIRPIHRNINNISQENDNLIKQRDLLLPRLMSGKLEVKQ